MRLGQKHLGLILGILIAVLVIIIAYVILNINLDDSKRYEMKDRQLNAESALWDELVVQQDINGSWDDDLDTTMIASNALSQSVELMENNEDDIDWDLDGDQLTYSKIENEQAVLEAENWTLDNYEPDAPLVTQTYVNIHFNAYNRLDADHQLNVTLITQQSNDIILDQQLSDGSWNGNIKQTAFSLYVIKKNNQSNKNAVITGENWLISQQENGSWGSTSNNIYALIGLYNSSYDLYGLVELLIKEQAENGSFGDLETTAWAVIALSMYDVSGSSKAAELAREWLINQEYSSNHELALVALAESEYLINEINRPTQPILIQKGKGPPGLILILIGAVCITIILLLVLFNRLSEHEAFDGLRSNIYEYIKAHPGVNQNEIKRQLNISSSSIRHHLRILEKFEYIIPYNDGKYLRYYINRNGYSFYTNGNGYKKIISILRKTTAASIVKYIMNNPNTTQRNLAKALKLHPSTIHWHTKSLLSSNIILAKRNGKSIQYQINEPMDIDRLLTLSN